MIMYKKTLNNKSIINTSEFLFNGESMEQYMNRIMISGEPINAASPVIYTDRKAGVIPEYNIRTDRFDLALDAQSTIVKGQIAKRMEYYKTEEVNETPTVTDKNVTNKHGDIQSEPAA